MLRPLLLLAATLLATPLATPAPAAETPPMRTTRTIATLVTDTDAIQPGTPLHVALRLRLAPGWHTYWKNPGDAGIPPELTLNVPTSGITWPTPLRLPEGPVMTYGYTGEVLLPVTLTPPVAPATPLDIEATASWLVCERICVPEEATFHLALPAGTPAPSKEAPLFAAAQPPTPAPFPTTISPAGHLTATSPTFSPATISDAWFIPATPNQMSQPASPPQIEAGTIRLALQPGPDWKPATPLAGILVLRDPTGRDTALQIDATPAPAEPTLLPRTLLLAALGGLLLNLMPCVFPVLAMKAIALARLSGQGRRTVRLQALSYTAGVLTAFTALGAILLALRSAGAAAGWGFQFQSPMLVAAMAMILFAVGLNLSGVFQFAGSWTGTGQSLATRAGHTGSFFTGLLAVIVATPCTAPFMGAAIAAALAAPPAITLLVFAAMGLGMAAPYATLAAAPGLVTSGLAARLPRPGPWMDILKGALAFPMYAAAAWLLWIVSVEAGPPGVLATAIALVLLAAAAWALGLAQKGARRLGVSAALVTALAALAVLPGIAPLPPAETLDANEQAYTPARLAALRAEGRPVFVNMTAAWCVTCLVNERIALSPQAVQQAFADKHVAYLKGDWTRADPAISAFLREHARDGVPLYVLYPQGDGQPTVLPQLLTEADLLSRLAALGVEPPAS